MALPTAPVAAGSLVGSFALANHLGRRDLAVGTMLGPLAWCAVRWNADHGRGTAGALTGTYLGMFGVSHAIAKQLGAWPSVLAVSAATGVAAHLAADRR